MSVHDRRAATGHDSVAGVIPMHRVGESAETCDARTGENRYG